MRIDLLMNKLCLVKSRAISKKACDKKLVKINDNIVKASFLAKENDIIEYCLYGFYNKIRILKMPEGNISKQKAVTYYEIIERLKSDF